MDEVSLMWIENDEILVISERSVTLDQAMERAQVRRDSFGSEMVERVWATVFASRRDLAEEYEKFFSRDYLTFGHFLHWRYGLSREVVKEAVVAHEAGGMVSLSNGVMGGGWGLSEWLSGPCWDDIQPGWDWLVKLFNARKVGQDEDQD